MNTSLAQALKSQKLATGIGKKALHDKVAARLPRHDGDLSAALLRAVTISFILSIPVVAQAPPSALFTNLAPKIEQEVIKTVQLSCTDIRAASCYSSFIVAADGGNRYDSKGNLYLLGGTQMPEGSQAIQVMDPSGQFSNVAVLLNANLKCTDTPSGALYTAKNIAGSAFNLGANALSVVTTNTATQSIGTCAAPGPMVIMYQTITLLRLK